MIEKVFSAPTGRVLRLKQAFLQAQPEVESARALIVTQAYRENEQLPITLKRAKVAEKIFNELPVSIRNDELIAGSATQKPRAASIFPEYSSSWVEAEFETMTGRIADPFIIITYNAAIRACVTSRA